MVYDTTTTESIDDTTKQYFDQLRNGFDFVGVLYSSGKDCLYIMQWLKENNIPFVPVYFEAFDTPLMQKYIAAHEKFFDVKIQKVRNWLQICELNERCGDIAFRSKYKVANNWRDKAIKKELINFNLPFFCDGSRAVDSMARQLKFKKSGPFIASRRVFHPAWRINTASVWRYLSDNKVPIPDSYLWIKRSLEYQADYEFWYLKEHHPEDYAIIKNQLINVDDIAELGQTEASKLHTKSTFFDDKQLVFC